MPLVLGVGYTSLLALAALLLTRLPGLAILGPMVLAILLGMLWKAFHTPTRESPGTAFSSKYLLRAGIVLMGFRLNFLSILDEGWRILLLDVVVLTLTLIFILQLSKWMGINQEIGTLVAVGTAICGAAAIVSIASITKAKQEITAISVAVIAILGTLGTVAYTLLFSWLSLDSETYGLLVGSTLHEVAHVVAAGEISGVEGGNLAILVKLGRVVLLIPVALCFGYLMLRREQQSSVWTKKIVGHSTAGPGVDTAITENHRATALISWRQLPIPWFVLGFLAVSLLNTWVVFPDTFVQGAITLSTFLLAMGMAGLGLGVSWRHFSAVQPKTYLFAILGTLFITLSGWLTVFLVLS